jgi:hypothetical protein
VSELDQETEIALAEYTEVVAQFRSLTDIRFKLLTYLPVGTIATVFLSKDDHLTNEPAIAAFALVVTVCIATYNKRNDQLYDELVSRAAELERVHLGLVHGAFSQRPTTWLKYGVIPVQHRWPIGLLYAATAALWAFMLVKAILAKVSLANLQCPQPVAWFLEALAPVLVIAAWQVLRKMEKARQKKLRKAVHSLRSALVRTSSPKDGDHADLVSAIVTHERILGVDGDTARRRIECQWPAYIVKHDLQAGSNLLSAVIDLPARWIEDVWTGRR